MENTNMISLIPDIDWTKETMVLYTRSGVVHAKRPKDQWTTFHREICIGTYKTCVYISEKDNYLSIKSYAYHSWQVYGRVSNFKNSTEEDTFLCNWPPYLYRDTFASHNIDGRQFKILDSETRVYKDRTMAYVLQVYYTDTEEIQPFYIVYYKGKYIPVETNEDIEKYAVMIGEKTFTDYLPAAQQCGFIADLRNKDIWGGQNDGIEFAQATKTLISQFFELDKNQDLNSKFLHKVGRKGAYQPSELRDLKALILIKGNNKQADNKEDRANALVSKLDAWSIGVSKNENPRADWYRIDDEIILLVTPSNQEENHADDRYLFTYNVKTKKRFYAEYYNNLGGASVWSFPIPSYEYITGHIRLRGYTKYIYPYQSKLNHTEEIKYPLETVIHCQNGISELFAGSNIGWILDNVDTATQIITGWSSDKLRKISEIFSDTYITSDVFAFIFSTSEPVLEQFLKSKLFNLYFKCIEDYKSENWLIPNKSNSKITTNYYENGYCREERCAQLEYLSKEKNLKKMFGMSMDQLRLLDSKYTIKTHIRTDCYSYRNNSERITTYYRGQYKLYGAEAYLGHNLSDLDMDSFSKLLDLVEIKKSNWGYESSGIDVVALTQYPCFKELSVKQKIELLADLKNSKLSEYSIKDYYSMREKLKAIQSVKPNIPDIWSEKRYPLIPKAGTRFVSYIEGTTDPVLDRRVEARDMFYQYGRRFRDTLIQEIKADGKLVGLLLKLSGGDMLQFLHDEISYWVSFYQDEANNQLFMQAMDRVKPLCWKDEKSGLEIIAPKDIADLKNEGHTLSHCVGTYVDAIISGKDNIMFLRRSDMVNSPFYTVEVLNDGQIRQVHCYQNGCLTAEAQNIAYDRSKLEVYNKTFNIVQFLVDWAKATKGKVKASSIKSSYGALCAVR